MDPIEKRRHPRQHVRLVADVMHDATGTATAVVDLSEGGACLQWSLPDDTVVGAPLRVRFVLTAQQSIEIEARVVRIAAGRAGVEFLPSQQRLVRQLLAEARAAD